MNRIAWEPVVEMGATYVQRSKLPLTLRDVWYYLYSLGCFTPAGVVKTDPHAEARRLQGTYKRLSELTSQGRREGSFPDLVDETRAVYVPASWENAAEINREARSAFRVDRTNGQEVTILLGVEKRGHAERLKRWFSDPYGIPVVPLGGFASQSFISTIEAEVERHDRPAVLIYAGDLDASGEDIERDLKARLRCELKDVRRVALTLDQVYEHNFLMFPGKQGDSRAPRFAAKYQAMLEWLPDHPVTDRIRAFGCNFQVELNALDTLHIELVKGLFQDAIDDFWDTSCYERLLEFEEAERSKVGGRP